VWSGAVYAAALGFVLTRTVATQRSARACDCKAYGRGASPAVASCCGSSFSSRRRGSAVGGPLRWWVAWRARGASVAGASARLVQVQRIALMSRASVVSAEPELGAWRWERWQQEPKVESGVP